MRFWSQTFHIQLRNVLFKLYSKVQPLEIIYLSLITFLIFSLVGFLFFKFRAKFYNASMRTTEKFLIGVVRVEIGFSEFETGTFLLSCLWSYDVIVTFCLFKYFNSLSVMLGFLNFVSNFQQLFVSQTINYF